MHNYLPNDIFDKVNGFFIKCFMNMQKLMCSFFELQPLSNKPYLGTLEELRSIAL